MKITFLFTTLSVGLILSGCGGGGSSESSNSKSSSIAVISSSYSSSNSLSSVVSSSSNISSISSISSSASSSSSVLSSSMSSSSVSSNSSSSNSSHSNAPLLAQTNNPINSALNNYKSWLSTSGDAAAKLTADKLRADNMITWQMPHGGFYKFAVTKYDSPWNGTAARSEWTGANGVELGTIDNNATVSEILFLADVYQRSGVTAYRDAARSALDFLLKMQYPSGGWPQVYPARTGTIYSNYVTFNDNAMVRVLILLDQASKMVAPLNGDLFTSSQLSSIDAALESAVEYILAAQIVQNNVKTAWCAQHDPVTYAPLGARSYELPSKSGKESVLVAAFLMTRPQTPEIEQAVKAALAWFRSDNVKVADTAYVKRASGSTDDTHNPIQSKPGSTMWYRFYDLDIDKGFFSGRLPTDNPPGNGKQYDIMAIEPERRYGYEWGGNYAGNLLNYAVGVGY